MKHTQKQIEKIVRNTTSFNGFLKEVYGKTDGNSRRKGKMLVEKFNIDTSHYKTPKYTKELLEGVVAKSKTMAEVCRTLGLKRGGGSQQFVTRRIKQFNIDFSHFEKPNFPKPKNLSWQEVLVERNEGHRRAPHIIRRCLVESGRKYECECEGCTVSKKWLGKPITLQVHHIDGNCLNDKPENLMFVCPNCHTQTPNWCNKARE